MRETIHSVLEHDDDLSIVASDEDPSVDGNSVLTGDGTSLSGSGTGAGGQRLKTSPADIVRRETKAVMILRYVILALLLIGGILIAWKTHDWVQRAQRYDASQDVGSRNGNGAALASLLRNTEDGMCVWSTTNVQFAYAQALEKNLQQQALARHMAAFTVSASMTSWVLSHQRSGQENPPEWPLVTIPDLDARVTGILEATSAHQVRVAPIIVEARRSTFQEFAVAEQQQECETCDIATEIRNPSGRPLNTADGTTTVPIWQVVPFTTEPIRLWNLMDFAAQATAIRNMQDLGAGVLTDMELSSTNIPTPQAFYFFPVFQDFQQITMVSTMSMSFEWQQELEMAIPFDLNLKVDNEKENQDDDNDNDVAFFSLLLESCSGKVESFGITGRNVTYTGSLPTIPQPLQEAGIPITLHGAQYYGDFFSSVVSNGNVCNYTVWLVPTDTLDEALTFDGLSDGEDDDNLNKHAIYTALVASLFAILIITFLAYDWLVEKRQAVVVNIATKSSAIVENLFPAQVRDRMLQNMQNKKKTDNGDGDYGGDMGTNGDDAGGISKNALPGGAGGGAAGPVSVKQFLSNDDGTTNNLSSPPIADLFPNTTVLFADIAGFTAWSSQREPPQVFTLLETLYRSFDVIAKKLKVFKVETIGDCYMAVTGLPNPDDAHAVHMSRFAYQCLVGMRELIRELEAMLGPGTSELALRVGLHSGPVTAGVLRGEKSRFQLFGDTVNTASRMESTGIRGKIQISQETADLLMAAGKSHWLRPREEAVVAKGKGELKTYWLDPTKKKHKGRRSTDKDIRVDPEITLNGQASQNTLSPEAPFDDKYARLIDWNVDVLLHHLARVISNRNRSPSRGSLVNHSSEVSLLPGAINDVAEVIALPPFDSGASKFRRARPDVSMLQQTREDLHEYVKRIALLYHDVPFHNFEHASHVTLCANKLLNRLINSDEYETEEDLHNATFGISSDPLTHFAIVFGALIHDADHTGLPNAQLVKDGHPLAAKFNNRSVAEQNSVHLGWELLMDRRFERLRKSIYQTNIERKRFRQLVINGVLATDIADREINQERQRKWERAFSTSSTKLSEQSSLQLQEDMNRKATAVIEHIIQVSDVAHTMQHWHIYRRWNERLFHEMHNAFTSGKVGVDPSTNWYIGELGFFDYYLIPLAMKLKECGVFGASGYEYISYVLKNKKEWERKGRQVV